MTVTNLAVHLDPTALNEQMARDVRAGLTTSPKMLPPKYFYDARGSELFDQITRLAEYYPTRAETAILQARADEIASLTQARTLIELGSGTSEKTRLLLRALSARPLGARPLSARPLPDGGSETGTLERFVPFDVDPAVLAEASRAVAGEHPTLTVSPVVGDFEHHLGELPPGPQRLLAFLGSTIGNLDPAQRASFLANVRRTLGQGDAFLLGVDLVKSHDRLVAAYDDALGVTAAFNKNVLHVINRELAANFDPDAFEHVATWNAEAEWIEMRLRSLRDQTVRLAGLDLDVHFGKGEEMRTEISSKFRRDSITAELAEADLTVTRWWTDPAGDYALILAIPREEDR